MSTEVGHHASRVYTDQDGHIHVPVGAEVIVESSGLFQNRNAAIVTAATTSIPNHGISRITSTAANTWSMAAPNREGLYKRIVGASTATIKVRSAARINSSSVNNLVIAMTNPSTKQPTAVGARVNTIELQSMSTTYWLLLNDPSTADVTWSSAT